MILLILLLLLGAYYLYPTFRYDSIRRIEEKDALWISEQMNVSYAYVIENIYKDESILREKLEKLDGIDADKKAEITARLQNLQGSLQEQALHYRKKAIKRGLDLQGGMHLVLEVDLVQLLQNLARQRDGILERILQQVENELTLDPTADFNALITDEFDREDIKLSQYFGEAGESNAVILDYLAKQAEDAINRSLEILRNRIDQFGVSEPSIQKQGGRRIVLELPGVQDPARARDLIGRTALLEFKLLVEGEDTRLVLDNIDKHLSEVQKLAEKKDKAAPGEFEVIDEEASSSAAVDKPEKAVKEELAAGADTDEAALDLSAALEGDSGAADTEGLGAEEFDIGEVPFSSLLRGMQGRNDIFVPGENIREVRALLADPEVAKQIPPGTQFLWSAKPELVGDGNEYQILYHVKSNPELTGSALSDAQVSISSGYDNPGSAGKPEVSLTLNRSGARTFSRITGANIGKRLAIVLDEKIHMAPVIQSKIPNGRARISGTADVDEASDIAIVLRAGALPTSVVIEEERTVGPSLGRDSIRKGTYSAIVGLILVCIFMMIYYGFSGMIANTALILNIVLIFAGLAFFGSMGMGATLSLPGIAGIILTIGMAVDANVLIFERIREELETGKTVWHAIAAGYDRAFTTILDANVTTLIAALVLLQFGTGPIKGFAVTLSIGIGCSLFTSIVVTRLIFDYITSRRKLTRLSI